MKKNGAAVKRTWGKLHLCSYCKDREDTLLLSITDADRHRIDQ